MIQILGLLGMYFDAAVVFVTNSLLLFGFAKAILWTSINYQFFSFSVSLQPFEYDPNEKNRHKFMVQAMFAPEGEINPDTLVRQFFLLKFISSEKATKFCEISTIDLTVTTLCVILLRSFAFL